MVDILHKIGTKASLDDVYQALTTTDGLSGWWTNDTKGDSGKIGGIIKFRFGDNGGFDMKVAALEPNKHILWEVIDGPEEWIGSKINWDLKQEDGYTIVLFKHQGWKEASESMHHCSTKWGVFLLSLKSLVETGKGAAFPNDIKIDNWN
jgi:uncharacterized protein YndB with AHSA1/START domain